MFQCGPTSLVAVLNGKCDLLYDAPFVFAEVNADIVSWGREADGEWKIINIDKTRYRNNVLRNLNKCMKSHFLYVSLLKEMISQID